LWKFLKSSDLPQAVQDIVRFHLRNLHAQEATVKNAYVYDDTYAYLVNHVQSKLPHITFSGPVWEKALEDTNLFEKTDVEMENEDIDDGENEYNGS